MKIKLIVLCTGICLLFSSCGRASTPTSLIKAPNVNNSVYSSNGGNINGIIQKFLPNGAKILEPSRIDSGKNVFSIDIDNDKSNEIIALFRIDSKYENGIIVLKKEGKSWTKIFEKEVESNSISMLKFMNVLDKEQKSLIVGYNISSHAGTQYSLYTFKNNKFEEMDLGMWKKFEILNTPVQNNKVFVFAGWMQDAGDVEAVDLYKIEDGILLKDDEFYQSYLPNIVNYYNGILEKYKNLNQLAWYHMIDAQIKGNVPNNALKSIDKVYEIKAENNNVFNVEDYKFKFLKAQALNKLGKCNESESILNSLILQIEKDISDSKDIGKKSDLSNMYLEKGKLYASLNKKDKAEEMFNKALSILEDIYKSNGNNKDIYDDININNIKYEIGRLK